MEEPNKPTPPKKPSPKAKSKPTSKYAPKQKIRPTIAASRVGGSTRRVTATNLSNIKITVH